MLKIITTLTVFLVGMLAKAQVTENRNTTDFSQVAVTGGIELIYNEAPSTSLRIESNNEATLKNVITEMNGKTLKITLKKGTEMPTGETVKVYVTANHIVALEAHSKAKITIEEQLNADQLDIVLDSGASLSGNIKTSGKTKLYASTGTTFNGRIEAAMLKGTFHDNARINLTGKVKKAAFQTTDSALLCARNFTANTIHMNANGTSVAKLHANDNIALNVTEQAKVSYVGYPEKMVLNEEAQAFNKANCQQLVSYNDRRN
ncbi:DUF2807 domain-containing protein [Flavobacterium sp.]|uniref:GIN domain-containing protein n=1 Tax=Flavobacterium sp. TaxID=239 RepID=UPI00261AFCF1|nr:DUF2807 domain-containing protein [Flavobacterium sp.]